MQNKTVCYIHYAQIIVNSYVDGHCERYYYDIYDLGQAPYNKGVINLRANQMTNFHKAHNHKQKLFLVIYLLCVHKKK